MNELETLDYMGITVAFSQESGIGTSKKLNCFTPAFVEVHAVVIAGAQVY